VKLELKNYPYINISIGFAIVLLLMLAMSFVGLTRMADLNWHMQEIVKDRNVKTEFAQVMKNSLRERAIHMHSISVLTDAFDVDAEFIGFEEEGARFANARHSLEKMRLSEAEKTILARIQALTQTTQPLVNTAITTSMEGDRLKSQSLIREQAIPAQKIIGAEIDKLISLEYAETELAWSHAEESYRSARLLIISLGTAATLLGLLIAFLVTRNAQQQASSLHHQAMFDR